MSFRKTKKRLVMLSLDGLSLAQFFLLGKYIRWFADILNRYAITCLDARPHTQAQPIWAQILTGLPWYETGCPGYARPARSLNDLELVSEHNIAALAPIWNCNSESQQLSINIPLLQPKLGRFWLSDGALPGARPVDPAELLPVAPFNSYKPRPYPSSTTALGTFKESVTGCLDVEKLRLDCALSLLANQDWDTCLWRISVFDLLAHLIGDDFLELQYLSLWEQIENFLAYMDQLLLEASKLLTDDLFCVLSPYAHTTCTARVNLNRLLERGGFCKLTTEEAESNKESFYRRDIAARMLSGDESDRARALITPTLLIDLAHSRACSPVYGAIYLNGGGKPQDRCASWPDDTVLKLAMFLSDQLMKQVGGKDYRRPTKSTTLYCPDLMVHVPGIEWHNTADGPVIDRDNKPKTTHSADGFVCLSEKLFSKEVIEPWQIAAYLKQACL